MDKQSENCKHSETEVLIEEKCKDNVSEKTSDEVSEEPQKENNSNFLKLLVRQELLSTIKTFINQLGLIFEDLQQTITKIDTYIEVLEKDEATFDTFVESSLSGIQKYKDNITHILFTKGKIKMQQYSFLQELTLFQFDYFSGLNFGIFDNENKNTKKTIVEYLHTMYMSCVFLSNLKNNLENENESDILKFLNDLQTKFTNEKEIEQKNAKVQKQNKKQGNGSDQLNNVFDTLLSNQQLFNIAKDISVDMQKSKVDPFSLINSILSGKPNKQVNDLVQNISKTIDQKITSGELDKGTLENQAESVMNAMQKTDFTQLASSLNNGNIKDIGNVINNLGKKNFK